MTELAAAAHELRERGLSVFPVGRDKHPMIEWKPYQTELPHADEVAVWWDKWPAAGIGVATGAVSDIVVLDADGPDGIAALKALQTPATTWLSETGRGYHQFFKHPGRPIQNRAGLRPGLDVRGDGGYVIVPPSVHASGKKYEWRTAPSDLPLAELPSPVLELLLSRPASPAPAVDGSGEPIPEGQRDATLASLAGTMRRRGLDAPEILAALLEVNCRRCKPPLPEIDVRRIAKSIGRYPAGDDGLVDAPAAPAGEVDMRVELDAVVLSWPAHGVQITAPRHRIRDHGGQVRAEIDVTRHGGHLHLADLPLASTAARRTEVKALEEVDRAVPWRDLIAHACRVLMDLARGGDGPAVELVGQIRGGARYLVEPVLLAAQPTVIYAPGGTGKGYMAMALAAAVASGLAFPGVQRPRSTGHVLYLDWEADRDDGEERVLLVSRGLGLERPRGVFYKRMTRSITAAAPEIRAELQAIGNVQLLVVDSLVPAGGGGDRAWHDIATDVFGTLRSFAPAAQLVVGHMSKDDSDRPGAGRIFGSAFNWNLTRSAWEVRRTDGAANELVLGLYHRKANNTALHRPIGLRFAFEPDGEAPQRVTIEPHDLASEPELLARATVSDQIRAALRAGSRTVAALATTLGKSDDTIRKTLGRMAEHRAVVKLPDGTWGLPA